MVSGTGNAAGCATAAGRRRRRAWAASPLAGAFLLATAVGVGARDASAYGPGIGGGGAALPSPLVSDARVTSVLTGFPELGPGLSRSRGPAVLAAFVPTLPSSAAPWGPIEAAEITSPIVSGLPWRSGASCAEGGFAAWRGRAIDVNVSFIKHQSWQEMFGFLSTAYYRVVGQFQETS